MRLAAVLLLCSVTGWASDSDIAWDSRRLSTPVIIDGRTIPYREFAIYLMPGQPFSVSFHDATGHHTPVRQTPLKAPDEPGLTSREIENPDSGEVALIHVFTLVPAGRVDARGYLNGYRIGSYPQRPLRGLDIYRPPDGFVEVTAENAHTRISPNFRLEQFVSKQEQGYPKYVVLRANLLLKLENILATLNRSGRTVGSLTVMSGYRTPWYNQAIGNVPYSRHVWGGAADVYIDESPPDGRMDDLNGDGRIDRDDARWLADFVNRMSRRGDFGPRIGGLGIYGSNAAPGPFIHVDVRGSAARW